MDHKCLLSRSRGIDVLVGENDPGYADLVAMDR